MVLLSWNWEIDNWKWYIELTRPRPTFGWLGLGGSTYIPEWYFLNNTFLSISIKTLLGEWQLFIWLDHLTIRGSKPKSKELGGDRVEKANGDWIPLEFCPVRNWPPNDVAWIKCMLSSCTFNNLSIYLPAVLTAKVWPRLNAFSRRSSMERPWKEEVRRKIMVDSKRRESPVHCLAGKQF